MFSNDEFVDSSDLNSSQDVAPAEPVEVPKWVFWAAAVAAIAFVVCCFVVPGFFSFVYNVAAFVLLLYMLSLVFTRGFFRKLFVGVIVGFVGWIIYRTIGGSSVGGPFDPNRKTPWRWI